MAEAVRLIDEDGFASLTMRNIASGLGVGTMSLYWHVADRDELIALAIDDMLGDIELPEPTEPWREQIAAICRAYRATIRRHRGLIQPGWYVFTARNPGPKILSISERLVGAMRSAGFDDAEAAAASIALSAVTSLSTGEASGESVGSSKSGANSRRTARDNFSADSYPNLAAMASQVNSGSEDLLFEVALAVILDGLDSRLASRPKTGRNRAAAPARRGGHR